MASTIGRIGGDADAARNEYITWGFDEREVVAWAADVDCGSSEQGLVDVLGSAPALRLTQDGDSPHRAIARVAAERVLPYEPVAQQEVDVRTGSPRRELGACRVT